MVYTIRYLVEIARCRCKPVDERLRFVARLLEGEKMAALCREGRPPEESDHPYHDRTVRVTRCGRICIGRRKINLSQVFAGQIVGVREVADKIWLVSFMEYDLGFFDEDEERVEPASNPYIPEKL